MFVPFPCYDEANERRFAPFLRSDAHTNIGLLYLHVLIKDMNIDLLHFHVPIKDMHIGALPVHVSILE